MMSWIRIGLHLNPFKNVKLWYYTPTGNMIMTSWKNNFEKKSLNSYTSSNFMATITRIIYESYLIFGILFF